MKKFYILDESGYPKLVKSVNEYSAWAVKNPLLKMTQIHREVSPPVEIVTAFNYKEGYFMTFKYDGIDREPLEKSYDKTSSELVHQKYVDEFSTTNNAIK